MSKQIRPSHRKPALESSIKRLNELYCNYHDWPFLVGHRSATKVSCTLSFPSPLAFNQWPRIPKKHSIRRLVLSKLRACFKANFPP
jgi:hypothetical protein